MKFIRLTQTFETRPVMVNMDLVQYMALGSGNEGTDLVFDDGNEDAFLTVNETIEEIKGKL